MCYRGHRSNSACSFSCLSDDFSLDSLIFTEAFALQLGHPHLHLFIFFRNLLQLQLASWRRCRGFLHRMCVCLSNLVHHTRAFPPRLWKNVQIGHSFRGFFWSQELTQRISSCTPCTLHCHHGRTSHPFSPLFLMFTASERVEVLRLHLLSANRALVAVLHWDDLQASWQTVASEQEHALKV